MKKILSVLTGRVWSAFLVGTFLTALVQSSTAITVLTVGFVNAGLMKLPQAIGIIYGANIGTTITAQLMAFSFKFRLTDIALPVLGIGFLINYMVKNETLKNIGEALMGFGMMFLGLKILNSGIPFMQQSETLKFFFQNYARIPIVGIIIGACATAMVQSSSATVGLVMVLAQAGLIDLNTAVCIMLGDNIGTCVTAQLASLTGNIHARRTAWAHTLYNVFGVLLTGLMLPLFVKLVQATTLYFQHSADISAQIANSHTIFNLLSAVVFLPITKYYVKFLETVIRGKGDEKEASAVYLDRLLLNTPVAAFKAAISEIARGAEIAKGMIVNVADCLEANDTKKLDSVAQDENIINQLQKDITAYIVEISKHPLSEAGSVMVPALIKSINNVERAADHAQDLTGLVRTKIERRLNFSPEAMVDLKSLEGLVIKMFDNTIKALNNHDAELAISTIEMEGKVDEISKKMLEDHIKRLEQETCVLEAGVVYLDIVNYYERIADHVYKVASIVTSELRSLSSSDDQR